jgi:hypothetical protein
MKLLARCLSILTSLWLRLLRAVVGLSALVAHYIASTSITPSVDVSQR